MLGTFAMIALAAQAAAPAAIPSPAADEALAASHFQSAMRARGAPDTLVHLGRALIQAPRPTPYRGLIQCMRGMILLHLENEQAGAAAVDECYHLVPNLPQAQILYASQRMEMGDLTRAVPLVISAMKADPLIASLIPPHQIESLLRRLDYRPELSDLRRQLIATVVDSGTARESPALFSGLARNVMADRIAADDNEGALSLLMAVSGPDDGLALLVDRRFEPIWPQIEEWAGGDLKAQRDQIINLTRAAADLDPSREKRNRLVRTLLAGGETDEALGLVQAALADTDSPDPGRFEVYSSSMRLAELRAATGERDPVRIVAPVHAVLGDGIGKQSEGLWNAVPNLALLLLALDRPTEALAVLDRFPVKPADLETPTAIAYFVVLRACAEARAGRPRSPDTSLADLNRRFADNRAALRIATYCIGTAEEQAALWISEIDDPARRGDALVDVLRARLRHGSHDVGRISLQTVAQRRIVGRPDIAAKFSQHGRTLPASFEPALRGWLPAN